MNEEELYKLCTETYLIPIGKQGYYKWEKFTQCFTK